ncbi:MAG: hypothetical protein WCH34_11250 [Bacteroidota bacterium]
MVIVKLPKIHVDRGFKGYSTNDLISFADGIKFTGDADATNPIHTDIVIGGRSADLKTTHDSRQNDKSLAKTNLEHTQFNLLVGGLDDNANYLEIIANKVANEQADLDAGINVVNRIGYHYSIKEGAVKNIGFIDSGEGWAHAHEAKAVDGAEIHAWEVGIALAKGTPPTSTHKYFILEADVIFNHIDSGKVLAYRHGSLTRVSHIAKSATLATATSAKGKTTSMLEMNKANHPVFNITEDQKFEWGEWRYIIIQ